MGFSFGYATLFVLAGFTAASYHIKMGEKAKWIPLLGLIVCFGFNIFDEDGDFRNEAFFYGFLTAIEYACGFGLAHAFNKKE